METDKKMKVSKGVIVLLGSIVEEAKKLILKEGLLFNLDELSSNLKISKKTIYKHVKSKEEIIRIIILESYDYTKTLQKEISVSDLDLVEKIKALMMIVPQNKDIYTMENMKTLKTYYPSLYQEVNDMFNTDWQKTFDLIDEAKQKGLLKPFDNNLFRVLFVEGIFFEYDKEITYQNRLNGIINLLFEGVKQ